MFYSEMIKSPHGQTDTAFTVKDYVYVHKEIETIVLGKV